MDDCLYNMGGMGYKTLIALPPKFKISDVEKFDGTGDPKQHVWRYLSIPKMKRIEYEANFTCLSPLTYKRCIKIVL